MRVLLVEDEPAAARVLAKGLREHAYAVDVAGDGEAALFQVSTADYDAVIRGDIAEHVWDDHYDPLSNVVDVYIQRLRRKLDAPGADSMIRTRRGEGYQLIGPAGGAGDR